MSKTLANVGEFGLIDHIRRQMPKNRSVIKGIGDDAAVLAWTKDKHFLLTTDMLVEDVHFTRKMLPQTIGHKALSCNISDIAAMGGVPKHALISLGVPKNLNLSFVDQLYEGLKKTAKHFRVLIVGGDTVYSQKIIINVALTGEVKKKQLVTRDGAKKGDQIFVTGPLGNSLKRGWHLNFIPRVKESQYLVQHFHPTAMIDISDGLAADLGHILEESGVGAVLCAKHIPRRKGATLNQALYDGEDFELIFTLSSRAADKLKGKFYRIGEITNHRQELQLVDSSGRTKNIETKGYAHF